MKAFNVLVLLAIIVSASCTREFDNPLPKIGEFFAKHGPEAKQKLLDLLHKGKDYYNNHKEEVKAIIVNNRDKVADFIEERNADLDNLIDQLRVIIGSLKEHKTRLVETYAQKLKDASAQEIVDRIYDEVHKGKDF